MSLVRFTFFKQRPRLALLLAGPICAAGLGCTAYSELEGRARPEAGTPATDGSPPDISRGDIGTAVDAPSFDIASDAPADAVVAPGDVVTRDTSTDAMGDDAATRDTSTDAMDNDVATPPAPDASVDRAADTTAPPGPEGGPDVTGQDIVDAEASVDAEAAAPPRPDADGGVITVDVREAGPTCWGTPSTHDEDLDGIVDECDNCPSMPNADQANVREVNAGGTADGVGDACDPRPTAGGDSIYLFDGLNFTSLPAEWAKVGLGNWTATGTTLTPTTPTTPTTGHELTRSFPTSLGNYLAETTFALTTRAPDGNSSLTFRVDTSGNGWRCTVGTSDGITGQFFMSRVTAGTSETPPDITNIDLPQVKTRYRVLGGAYNGNIYCRLGSGESQNRSISPTTGGGVSGFHSTRATAAFEYLLVYQLGGTLP